MKNKIGNKNDEKLSEKLDKFLHSNTIPAMTTKLILVSIALGGVAFGGAIIPGLLRAMKGFDFGSNNKDHSHEKIQNAFYSLKRRKFIKVIKDKKGKIKVKLTNKGKSRVREFIIDNLKIEKQDNWDRKWRILIFDIPVKKNWAREALRKKIKYLGFYQFQGSVWFYPYPCEDEVLAVAEFFKVSEYIEIITAEKILHEKELMKHFKIK